MSNLPKVTLTEDHLMLEERLAAANHKCQNLTNTLIEVDYLISYGKILEARTIIDEVVGENKRLNNQRGILNGTARS